jgi:RES domain
MLPKTTLLSQDNTHRLIPERFREAGDSVLARLGLPPAQMEHLYELDDATNDRVTGESVGLPGIGVRELVFGVPHFHIINATFTHARPAGSRFNGPDRGAWYAGFSLKTAQTEVGFHYAESLREVNWQEEETVAYREYLADLHGEFCDLRGDTKHRNCLDPDSYRASQRLAGDLLERGSAGIVYPSVRDEGGTCIACFRPALVANVREGALVTLTFADAFAEPEISVTR